MLCCDFEDPILNAVVRGLDGTMALGGDGGLGRRRGSVLHHQFDGVYPVRVDLGLDLAVSHHAGSNLLDALSGLGNLGSYLDRYCRRLGRLGRNARGHKLPTGRKFELAGLDLTEPVTTVVMPVFGG